MKTRFLHSLCTVAVMISVLVGGCSKAPDDSAAATAGHGHEHKAPHGGTAVVLGDEAYHLEFVHNPESGTLTAYVLDAHMENFVRTNAASFEVIAQVGDEARPLTFRAAANTATGETVGDTAQFDAPADWLKSTPHFEASLKSLTIRGRTFSDVKFTFPGAAHP